MIKEINKKYWNFRMSPIIKSFNIYDRNKETIFRVSRIEFHESVRWSLSIGKLYFVKYRKRPIKTFILKSPTVGEK